MRIVSLLPSTTEICFALGLADQLVAVTHECDYPPAAREKPKVTRNVLPPDVAESAEIDRLIAERVGAGASIYELDVARLEELAPDLILTQQLCPVCAVSYDDVVAIAERLPGTPRVVSIEPHTVGEILASIRAVGRLTGRAATAEAVVAALRGRIDWLRACVAGGDGQTRRVVCLEWLDPPMVGGHWVPEMVELAGGHDLLGRAGEPSRYVEPRQIVEAQPEVLVLMPCGFDLPRTVAESSLLTRLPGIEAIPAARSGQVYAVDGSSYFNRPGPRIVGGIEILAGVLHPEGFAGPGLVRAVQPVPLRLANQVG